MWRRRRCTNCGGARLGEFDDDRRDEREDGVQTAPKSVQEHRKCDRESREAPRSAPTDPRAEDRPEVQAGHADQVPAVDVHEPSKPHASAAARLAEMGEAPFDPFAPQALQRRAALRAPRTRRRFA